MSDDRDRCGCKTCKEEKHQAGIAGTEARAGNGSLTKGNSRGKDRGRNETPSKKRRAVGNGPTSSPDETTSLLPTSASHDPFPRPTFRTRTHAYLSTRLSSRSLVFLLLSTSFPTGILDASTYTDFRMFASNQTGNVIVLTVAVAQGWNARSLLNTVSVGGFATGGLISGRWAHWGGQCPRRRSWVLGSSVLQTVLCGTGLALLHFGKTRKDHWILLVLLSLASGLQVSVARTSSIGEIPTAMLTSPMIDLATDPNLFLPLRIVPYSWRADPDRRKPDSRTIGRNRRLVYVAILVCGSIIGAAITKRWDTQVVLSAVVLCKAVIAVGVAVAPGDGESRMLAGSSGKGEDEENEAAGRNVEVPDDGIEEEDSHPATGSSPFRHRVASADE